MTCKIRSLLSELAVLADQVERDERRILGAALKRLKTAKDKEERRVLGEVVRRAEAVFQGFFGLPHERTQGVHKRVNDKAPEVIRGQVFESIGGDGQNRTADLWVMNPSL